MCDKYTFAVDTDNALWLENYFARGFDVVGRVYIDASSFMNGKSIE